MTVGFVGAGSWGTTLAIHLGELGHHVLLWAHGAGQREQLRRDRQNRLYLPEVAFPDRIPVVSCGRRGRSLGDANILGQDLPRRRVEKSPHVPELPVDGRCLDAGRRADRARRDCIASPSCE